jgi:hypothetical protein
VVDGVLRLEGDPRELTPEDLTRLFPGGRDAVSDSALIRAVIWWVKEAIAAGREPPVGGNLRTFWYRYLKPIMDGVAGINPTTGYTRLAVELGDLVLRRQVMRYSDLDLTDENWEHRRIGTRRPEVIVYAEQSGWMRDLRHLHEEVGCTVVCWQGQPSGITSEFTARHVLDAMDVPRPAELVSLTDYDPAGDIIMASFEEQLTACGLTVASNHRIVTPECFSAAEREMHAMPLTPRGKSQTTIFARWLTRTGGVDGSPIALSSEALGYERLRPVLVDHLATLGAP